MKTKDIAFYLCVGMIFGFAFPFDLSATTHAFGPGLESQAAEIQGLALGPALKIACILGAAWGLALSFMKQSFMPFVIFSAIGLVGGGITPKLIDSVYGVASLLLP
jgi:hypothetical protein